MAPLPYQLSVEDGEEVLSVVIDGQPRIVRSDSPRFDEILTRVRAGDATVVDLFDVAEALGRKFEYLTERVTARNGRIYFDGDEINNALTKQIQRYVAAGTKEWEPLVLFFEKVQTNVDPNSREQLYGFIERNEITIAENGDVVFYKGVDRFEEDGEVIYRPRHAGYGIIDGIEYRDEKLPQKVGSTVEMPRNMVRNDPHSACHTGLHAATFDFAQSFAGGTVLEIHVNPRDVVSVPDQANKVRVCRYVVVKEIEASYDTPLRPAEPQKAVQGLTGVCAPDNYVTPGKPRFEELATTAKNQKKSVKALATKKGWVQVGEDPKDRKSWKAPKASKKR